MNASYSVVELASFVDGRGRLDVGEVGATIPFEVRRIFTVTDVPDGAVRGGHVHRLCHQLLVAVAGTVVVEVRDAKGRHIIELARRDVGLHIPPGVYSRQIQFTTDAALLVLASHPYDPADYE